MTSPPAAAPASRRAAVCFVGQAAYAPPLDPTAAKKFRLLSGIARVSVVGFARGARPRRFVADAEFWLLPRLPGSLLRQATMLGMGSALAAWLVLRGRAEILVAQSPYEGVAAAVAKRVGGWFGRRVRLVVESHGDFEVAPFQQRRFRLAGLQRRALRAAARWSLAQADAVRSISAATTRQLAGWAPGVPVVQFPAWTDIAAFSTAPRSASPTARVLFVGTLSPVKGAHHLVAAFAAVAREHAQARLRLVGRALDPAYRGALQAQVEALGVAGRVEFAQPMPQAELAREMAAASVLVLPSLSEGLGRVVFEAMAAGTPVIGSAVGGIPELVEEGRTGWLVPPGDEQALAQRLAWVLAHQDEAREAGRRARDFATTFFSDESYLGGYQQLFAAAAPAGAAAGVPAPRLASR